MDKIYSSFKDAVADIPDGACIALYYWVFPGVCQNLLLALREQGAKDLTLVTPNYISVPFPEEVHVGPSILLSQLKKVIAAYYSSAIRLAERTGTSPEVAEMESRVEFEATSHGVLVERLRAAAGGLGGFYSPVGIGTIVEGKKEKRVIDGKEYLLEMPLKPDFGLVRAYKADRYGNLVYKGVSRGSNPIIAMAAEVTIAEVDEIVDPGDLDPEEIVTPAAFVDRIVEIPEGGFGSHEFANKKLQEFLSIDWLRDLILSTKKEEGS
jgi:3-oxoacid CoA-transferase A subunit